MSASHRPIGRGRIGWAFLLLSLPGAGFSAGCVNQASQKSKPGRAFLAWVMKSTEAAWISTWSTPCRNRCPGCCWQKLYTEDPESRQGMYLRMAMAAALGRPAAWANTGAPRPSSGKNATTISTGAHILIAVILIVAILAIAYYLVKKLAVLVINAVLGLIFLFVLNTLQVYLRGRANPISGTALRR